MPSLAPHSLFDAVFTADQFHRLGWVVVHSLWQAAAVAAVLAIALRLLPRQSAVAVQLRYLVATLALLSLPAACAVTYAIVSPPSAVPLVESSHADRAVSLGAGAAAAGHQAAINGPGAASAQSAKAQNVAARIGMISRPAVAILAPWLPLFAAVWLAGAVAAAARLGIGWSLTRRLVATATPPADARWQARLDHWAGALGVTRSVRFLSSARVDVPLVFGWFRPAVVWPLAALTGMPPDQIDAILAHELAHVRRHDVLVNLLQSCIEALFFHHPAAWWISAQVRAEREHCADDLAVRALAAAQAGSRLSYAAALLSLEERRQQTLLAVAADGGSLGDRVRRLAGVEQQSGHPARLAAAVLVLAAVVATAASVATTGRRVEAALPAARPDGLPADTNNTQTQSLSAEQAKSLVEEFKAKGSLPDGANGLYLRDLTSLSVETAAELAKFTGTWLCLDGLSSLDAKTAKALAGFKGHLSINGLPALEAETAKAVAESQCEVLTLNGVTTLDAEAARELARFRGKWLYLNGLQAISADTAKSLANFGGEILSLQGLVELSPEAAQGLATYTGTLWGIGGINGDGHLYLHGLTKLSPEAAAQLAAFFGEAMTLGMPEISPEVARELARWNPGRKNPIPGVVGFLKFPNLTSLSLESAKAIADAQCGSLMLGGERFENPAKPRHMTVDAPALQALGGFKGKGKISLSSSLESLSPDAAKAIAGSDVFDGQLFGISAFEAADSVAVATALATRKGRLWLPNLKRLSPRALNALLAKQDIELPPIDSLELIPEPDGSPTVKVVIPEGFEERQKKLMQP